MVGVRQLDLHGAEELRRQIRPFVEIRKALRDARLLGRSTRDVVGDSVLTDRRELVALKLVRRSIIPIYERLLREYRASDPTARGWMPHDEVAFERELRNSAEEPCTGLLECDPGSVSFFLDEADRLSKELLARIRELEY